MSDDLDDDLDGMDDSEVDDQDDVTGGSDDGDDGDDDGAEVSSKSRKKKAAASDDFEGASVEAKERERERMRENGMTWMVVVLTGFLVGSIAFFSTWAVAQIVRLKFDWMEEALQLFDQIVNSKWFKATAMILFLNKRDLFQKKIRDVRIGGEGCFRDYDGPPNDYAAGVDYFLRYFLKQNRDPDRKVFHHVTCATDTANVQVVMDSTRAMIIQDSLNF